MNNQECVIAVLASHREARQWADEAVALDLLAQLGLDPQGEAAHPSPVINASTITEDEVLAAENAAKEAAEKAKAAREALDAQNKDQSSNPDAGADTGQAKADADTGLGKASDDTAAADASVGTGRRGRGASGP